jgi:heavy metal translocating P-type ATPase
MWSPNGRKINTQGILAIAALAGIGLHFLLRLALPEAQGSLFGAPLASLPLIATILVCGIPEILEVAAKMIRREFSADLIAAVSIVASVILHQYLAGALVVLMATTGRALEDFAVRNASSVLEALAKRMPSTAHRRSGEGVEDAPLEEIRIGDVLVVFPHENCPVDGVVLEGQGNMDESYLTGEPYVLSKGPGSDVLSGAVNGDTALIIQSTRAPRDSRYAKIMKVMRDSARNRPNLRRLGDELGALYAPLVFAIAIGTGWITGEWVRFLAVLVVATPCPLLIAIPVAVIGSVSLCARRGIIIKNPAILEKIGTCRTAIFDKTGTLTYGRPELTEILPAPGITESAILSWAGGLERYSRHPLAGAVVEAANRRGAPLSPAGKISERPGRGLTGIIDGDEITITSRKKFLAADPVRAGGLPQVVGGLECIILRGGGYAGTLRFRDEPRESGKPFIKHLHPRHGIDKVMIVSGDRESEVRYLADKVGIDDVHAGQSPEEKLELVRAETRMANTLFLGDGINDAPALTAATVGIAFGQNSDIASEAADGVVLESSLQKVDELLHIGKRMRALALQSAVGGMALSLAGIALAAMGMLPPVAGAVAQEAIDALAIANALRAALAPRALTDIPAA